MNWVELTDEDAERLVRTITRAKDYAEKMVTFQSGFIPPERRWLQTSAHELYDELSPREREVFSMRIQQHTFPIIADDDDDDDDDCRRCDDGKGCICVCGVEAVVIIGIKVGSL